MAGSLLIISAKKQFQSKIGTSTFQLGLIHNGRLLYNLEKKEGKYDY